MTFNKLASNYVIPCVKCKRGFGLWVYHAEKSTCPLNILSDSLNDTPLGPTELIEEADLEYERARVDVSFRARLEVRRDIMEKFIIDPTGITVPFFCEDDE